MARSLDKIKHEDSKVKDKHFLHPLGSRKTGPVFKPTQTPELSWSPERGGGLPLKQSTRPVCVLAAQDQTSTSRCLSPGMYGLVPCGACTYGGLSGGIRWFTKLETSSIKSHGEKVIPFWVLPQLFWLPLRELLRCYFPNSSLGLHILFF